MSKKGLIILAIIVSAIVIAAVLLPGYTTLQDLIAENRRLETRIAELGDSIEELKEEKEKLENDILYIEKVAREKLGVVREDEVILRERH